MVHKIIYIGKLKPKSYSTFLKKKKERVRFNFQMDVYVRKLGKSIFISRGSCKSNTHLQGRVFNANLSISFKKKKKCKSVIYPRKVFIANLF